MTPRCAPSSTSVSSGGPTKAMPTGYSTFTDNRDSSHESGSARGRPLRAGQIDGGPLLSPALVRFLSIDKLDDATLTREYVANLFAGFVKSNGATMPGTDRLTGLPVQTTGADQRPTISMEPGTMQEL